MANPKITPQNIYFWNATRYFEIKQTDAKISDRVLLDSIIKYELLLTPPGKIVLT